MKKLKQIFLAAVIISLILCPVVWAEGEGASGQEKSGAQGRKTVAHVIFIMVGGLSDHGIQSAYTPNLNGLTAAGVKTAAIGVLPRNPAAFRASLLTGADTDIHGYVESGKQIRTSLLPETVSRYGRSSAYIYPAESVTSGLFGGRSGTKTYRVNSGKNQDIITRAINVFNKEKPYFMGIEIPGIEKAIIKQGDSKKIAVQVNTIDEQIGRFLINLRNSGVYNNSLIVFAGDYGQNDKSDSAANQELTVPLIISGPGIRAGELPPVKITDAAPTVALLTGIQISPESSGKVLWNAFVPGSGFDEQNLLRKRVQELSEENLKITGAIYRLSEEKRLVRVEKEKINREKAEIENAIREKDSEINSLNWINRLLKFIEGVTVLVMGAGYVLEYIYLRKKFLMF